MDIKEPRTHALARFVEVQQRKKDGGSVTNECAWLRKEEWRFSYEKRSGGSVTKRGGV